MMEIFPRICRCIIFCGRNIKKAFSLVRKGLESYLLKAFTFDRVNVTFFNIRLSHTTYRTQKYEQPAIALFQLVKIIYQKVKMCCPIKITNRFYEFFVHTKAG
jgi:hypothetical protein